MRLCFSWHYSAMRLTIKSISVCHMMFSHVRRGWSVKLRLHSITLGVEYWTSICENGEIGWLWES
jgi:hypothetical protein